MRVQYYQREETIGTHNFDCCQLYVGTLSTPQGEIFNGITILWAGGASMESHLILNENEALNFASYLESVVNGNLPSKYKVIGLSRFFFNFKMALRMKLIKKEGNYIKYRMSFAMKIIWGNVNINSLQACAISLKTLYKNT